MRDKVSETRVLQLHPKIRDDVKLVIEEIEGQWPETMAIRVVQGGRSFAEQDELYAKGRTKPGKRVTNSKAGQSFHNYYLAVDCAILYDINGNGTYETLSWNVLKDFDRNGEADWMEMVDHFEHSGYTWGGRFSTIIDAPHFEKTFHHTWKELLVLYNNKKFIPGTKYVNI